MRLTRQRVHRLHRIPHRINVGVGSLHKFVDFDAAQLTDFETGIHGQRGKRFHAHTHQHHVSLKHLAAQKLNLRCIAILNEGGNAVIHDQTHAVASHFLLHFSRHLPIHRRQNLRGFLHQRDLTTRMHQIFGHLHSNKTGTYHDYTSRFGQTIQIGTDSIGVVHIAERENVGRINAWNRRLDSGSTRGQHKLVVRFLIRLTRFQIHTSYFLMHFVDRSNFGGYPHICIKTIAERGGCLKEKRISFRNHATNIIR